MKLQYFKFTISKINVKNVSLASGMNLWCGYKCLLEVASFFFSSSNNGCVMVNFMRQLAYAKGCPES